MKKLFRTSKSTVDPLPPPPPPNTHSNTKPQPPPPDARARSPPPPPPPGKKSFQSLMMGGGNNANNGDAHEHKGWGFGGLGGEKVTPFPIDAGRDRDREREREGHGHGVLSKKREKERPQVPTLQELQSPNADWRGTGAGHGMNGHYDPPPPSSTSPSNHPYLPPGARPPSPSPGLRSDTPTRYPYTSTPSQGSQTSVHRERERERDETPRGPPVAGAGRDRGYSSASDYEPPVPLPKMQPIRSPLAYPPPLQEQYAAPHPVHPPPSQAFSPPQPPHHETSTPWSAGRDDTQRMDGSREKGEKEKKKFWGVAWGEKKDKHKERDRDTQSLAKPMMEEKRPSFEAWRDGESTGPGSTGHHSHHSQSLGHSVPGQGMQMSQSHSQTGHYDGYASSIDSAENVTQALDILVRDPDPAMSSIYAVCDRVNQSQTPDSICKEAAKALRRHFKHGTEGERRATAKIWLIMMRNISNDAFRHHAGSKKFMSPLETILLAPANRAVVSPQTYRLLTEILADLTFMYGGEKGCEGLLDLWKKVKLPQEPERGQTLPPKHHLYAADNLSRPEYASPPDSRRGSEPVMDPRSHSPDVRYGPAYAALPNHSDDIRRLLEESIAAKESARVLTEALVFTRPEDLPSKPIIKEFYRKCFMAHESLTGQMDWAQAEASRSRENVNVQRMMTTDHEQDVRSQTFEEEALGSMFEAHSALAEAIRQHDELERMAQDEMELREVRERSRKDTRMDRNDLLLPGAGAVRGSGSRSPSPAPHSRLPDVRHGDSALPEPRYPQPQDRSRTPSPEQFAPPKMSGSPARAPSPLSKAKGPRPLPDPLKRNHNSNPALNGVQPVPDVMNEDGTITSTKPSRKALGKRRAVVDEDNDFDPDDMFGGNTGKKESSASSDESLGADEDYSAPPVKYAYDAYQEKLQKQKAEGGSSGPVRAQSGPRPGTEAFRA